MQEASIVYNVTAMVQWSIQEAWLTWMREIHIPEVMATGCFTGSRMYRLLEVDETEGPTYAIQYLAGSKANYQHYIENHAAGLRAAGIERWGNQFIAFRSLMEEV